MERSLAELREDVESRLYGKYRGIVRDVDDPAGMGRIVAEVPAVYGEKHSPWALPCVPFAGAGHGLVTLPELDDGVWLEFEQGDPDRPIWTGAWWGRDEMPEPGGEKTRVLATSAGHKLVLDDDGGEVRLLHSGGAELTMSDDEVELKIGSASITLSDREIAIELGGKQVTLSNASVSINNGALEVK